MLHDIGQFIHFVTAYLTQGFAIWYFILALYWLQRQSDRGREIARTYALVGILAAAVSIATVTLYGK